MKQFLASLAALALLLLGAGAASAIETGTPAWSIRPLVLFEGPGAAYDQVGEVEGEARIYVDRCSRSWCRIHVGHVSGWTSLYDIAWGHEPRGPLTGPRLKYKSGGPGTVCLYEGHNFTGESICAGPGRVYKDLLLIHADNAFSSISIEGNVSVIVCRDREFKSYCERINDSEPALHGFLDNNVSSVRVY